VPFYAEVDRQMAKYPLDVNRATQLMADAGYARDAQGFFASKDGHRFHLDFAVQQSSEIERMQAILSDSWRRAGFDVRTLVMGVQQFTQQETRHTLPGLGYAFFQGEKGFISAEIGSAANRWTGTNRTGWSNPDYDRIYAAWNSSLDSGERSKNVVQMMTIVSQNVPGYALYFSEQVHSFVSTLRGPTDGKESSGFGATSKGTTVYWNIQDWTFV
jgi:peptide/nickel transport system substrate-binding protein